MFGLEKRGKLGNAKWKSLGFLASFCMLSSSASSGLATTYRTARRYELVSRHRLEAIHRNWSANRWRQCTNLLAVFRMPNCLWQWMGESTNIGSMWSAAFRPSYNILPTGLQQCSSKLALQRWKWTETLPDRCSADTHTDNLLLEQHSEDRRCDSSASRATCTAGGGGHESTSRLHRRTKCSV